MNKKLIIYGVLAVLIFSQYSGGPANTTQQGYTGAPCEIFGTQCRDCHFGGLFGPPVTDVILEDTLTGQVIQSYWPGRTYKVTVHVESPRGFPAYGMQATVLDADGEDIGTWAVPSSGNTQISPANVNCGDEMRNYIEHKFPSLSSFNAYWTAPLCDIDTARFYHIGNAVNRNGGQSGDNGGTGSMTAIPPIVIDSLLLAQDAMLMGVYRAQEFIALNGIVGSGSNVYASSDFSVYVDESLVVSQTGILTIDVDTCK